MVIEKLKSSGIICISLLFLFLSVTANSLTAENLSPFQRNTSVADSERPLSEGTLTIIAVMAEFQPDDNAFTTGNGIFGPGSLLHLESELIAIDPLPHNHSYFEARLEFVKNYFERMSDGRLQIDFVVLPEIVRLPNQMANYSPVGEDPDPAPLASLVADTWLAVAEKGDLPISMPESDRTAFVIFHAGVGRDVELTGTTLDRTPQDIPSAYLSRSAMAELLDDPSFSGIPIDNGRLLADHSLILPRTLSRPGETVTGEQFVLPLSVNGMATAQIGSRLGLPDLFNTQTGQSGIGRFGLMDGAGIFAYNGLFPPELSAWEKIHMGWADPVTIRPNTPAKLQLPAGSLRQPGSLIRIPISADEYFLLENRHRDPQNVGVTLTIQTPNGDRVTQTITNANRAFTTQERGFEEQLAPGVVVGVSNYDFALPGGIFDSDRDPDGTRELNGGILIWHIDESVIRARLGREGINDDLNRRGVRLVEADGVQDIGFEPTSDTFQSEANGTPFDFWWSGNDATVITQSGARITLYENEFGPQTTPDNRSNSGSPSPFRLFDFSDTLPLASVRIEPVALSSLYRELVSRDDLSSGAYTPDTPYFRLYPKGLTLASENGNQIVISGSDWFRIYHADDDLLSPFGAEGRQLRQPLGQLPDGRVAVADAPSSLNSDDIDLTLYSIEPDGPQQQFTTALPGFTTGHISFSEADPTIDADLTTTRISADTGEQVDPDDGTIQRSAEIGGFQSSLTDRELILDTPSGRTSLSLPIEPGDSERLHTGLISYDDGRASWYLLGSRDLILYDHDSENGAHLVRNRAISWPAIVDLKGDGTPRFLFTDSDRNRLYSVNRYGAVTENFPIKPPSDIQFTGTPLLADLNGDGSQEMIVTGSDGFSTALYLYDLSGLQLEDSPLTVGGTGNPEAAPLTPLIFGNRVIAVSGAGDLRVWEFPEMGDALWPSLYGETADHNVTGYIRSEDTDLQEFALLNPDETYNWPNPARENTYLRLETAQPAEISIKITTLSGRTIYDRTINSGGGSPEELEIDTSGWSSGAYFGLITARAGGSTERKLIRIAVAR